jgi:hypothetical protein
MARINVKDLPQSVDLERKAMQATAVGARSGVCPVGRDRPTDLRTT